MCRFQLKSQFFIKKQTIFKITEERKKLNSRRLKESNGKNIKNEYWKYQKIIIYVQTGYIWKKKRKYKYKKVKSEKRNCLVRFSKEMRQIKIFKSKTGMLNTLRLKQHRKHNQQRLLQIEEMVQTNKMKPFPNEVNIQNNSYKSSQKWRIKYNSN